MLNPCPGSLGRRRPARGKSACFVDGSKRTSSPCRQPPPPPSRPLCKLALIDYADHCIPMSYVLFRVCKRARQLCKLASNPSPVAPCATDLCYLMLPKLRNGAAKAPRTPRQGRTKNGVLRLRTIPANLASCLTISQSGYGLTELGKFAKWTVFFAKSLFLQSCRCRESQRLLGERPRVCGSAVHVDNFPQSRLGVSQGENHVRHQRHAPIYAVQLGVDHHSLLRHAGVAGKSRPAGYNEAVLASRRGSILSGPGQEPA